MKDEILEFIKRRFKTDCDWDSGNCYYFSVILQSRFGGELYYDPIIGHFYLKTTVGNFDFNGEYTPDSELKLNDIKQDDPIWYFRLVKDCML